MAKNLKLKPKKLPIIIHCSAGIGRTGTLVALDICRQHLRKTGKLNVSEVVKRIREQRSGCVQTDVQYVFIHRVLIQWCLQENPSLEFSWEQFNFWRNNTNNLSLYLPLFIVLSVSVECLRRVILNRIVNVKVKDFFQLAPSDHRTRGHPFKLFPSQNRSWAFFL